MNYFEAKDSIAELFPDKTITDCFDDSCVKEISYSVSDGLPHKECFCVMDKVRFDIEGVGARYMKIKNHRIQKNCNETLLSYSKKESYSPPIEEI